MDKQDERDAIDEQLIAAGASPWTIERDGVLMEWFIDRLIPVIPWITGRATMLEAPDDDNLPAG